MPNFGGLVTGYYPGESWVHKLPFWAKFLLAFLVSLQVIIFHSCLAAIISGVVLVFILLASRIPVKISLGFSALMLVILLGTAASGWIFTSFSSGITLALTLADCIWAARVVVLTTAAAELLSGIEKMLYALKFIGISPAAAGLAVMLMLNSISTLSRNFFQIRMAAKARGMEYNLAAQLTPFVVKTIASAYANAEALAARGISIDEKDGKN